MSIDRFHVTSHHFRSAILVYHFRLRNPRNFSTTIIPTSKMDSKEKEKESQNKSGVDYSFPISEYAKQLDFPVRDRYLQTFPAYERLSYFMLGYHGKRRNNFVCTLLRLQGWPGRNLFAYSKRAILS